MIPCREKKVTRIPAWCGIPDPKGDRPSSADRLKTAEDEWGFGGLAIRLTGGLRPISVSTKRYSSFPVEYSGRNEQSPIRGLTIRE